VLILFKANRLNKHIQTIYFIEKPR